MQIVVTVNTGPLVKYRQAIEADLRRNANGPVGKALLQWGVRMRSFLRRRFTRLSRSGGEWPPLKPATIRAKGSSSILIDTGTLRAALTPELTGRPGQFQRRKWNSIIIGYGPGNHPKARMPVESLAEIHQLGRGTVPVRKIIVPPDRRVQRQMVRDMERALRRLGDQTNVS